MLDRRIHPSISSVSVTIYYFYFPKVGCKNSFTSAIKVTWQKTRQSMWRRMPSLHWKRELLLWIFSNVNGTLIYSEESFLLWIFSNANGTHSEESFICHLAVKRSMTGKNGKKTRRREWGGRPRRENGFRSLLWEKCCHHHAFDVGRGREIKIGSGQSLVLSNLQKLTYQTMMVDEAPVSSPQICFWSLSYLCQATVGRFQRRRVFLSRCREGGRTCEVPAKR